jgi:hypothetical protein
MSYATPVHLYVLITPVHCSSRAERRYEKCNLTHHRRKQPQHRERYDACVREQRQRTVHISRSTLRIHHRSSTASLQSRYSRPHQQQPFLNAGRTVTSHIRYTDNLTKHVRHQSPTMSERFPFASHYHHSRPCVVTMTPASTAFHHWRCTSTAPPPPPAAGRRWARELRER